MIDLPKFIACDPGASGGFCYSPSGPLVALPMPGSLSGAAAVVRGAFQLGCSTLIIEKVGGYVGGMGQPGARMFTFGHWTGAVTGAAYALGMEVIDIAPRTWQAFYKLDGKLLTKSQWKGMLRDQASLLYPDLKPTLKTADAILIHHACINSANIEITKPPTVNDIPTIHLNDKLTIKRSRRP